MRYDYDDKGNLTRTKQPLTRCGETNTAQLIISRHSYDGVANVTRAWTEGTSHDIRTQYDAVFKLFPIRRYNASLDETGRYYGWKEARNGGLL